MKMKVAKIFPWNKIIKGEETRQGHMADLG